MKQETNNEMDLLLRRLARRDDATESNAANSHLDADELSAYAENALPAAARSRYTAHLADCSRCRELAVQLSAAVGVVVATESAKGAEPSGWKKFLAGLFTPMVLRYAVPALGLIVVAGIGFVMLRRGQSAPDVAQVTSTEQRPAALPSTQPEASINYSLNKSPSPEEFHDKQARGLQAESGRVQNAAPAVSAGEADVAKDAAAAQPTPEQQATTAKEPASPPKASATPAPQEGARVETEVRKKEISETPATPAPASERALKLQEREDKDNYARQRKPAPGMAVQGGVGSVADDKRDSLGFVGETRAVAGRRFRKQNGVWTDTAYDASKDVVTVRRNSEQYRGLVADEPAIKTIADTLDGPIIVVWKGRTYRIQ